MKRLLSVISCLAVMIFIIGVGPVSAQYTYKFRDSLGTYIVKFQPHNRSVNFAMSPSKPLLPETHELRFGLAWGAANSIGNNINLYEYMDYYGSGLDKSSYYLSNDHYYTFNLDYGYWCKEWFSVGVSATWVMGLCNVYNSTTHRRFDRLRQDFIMVMPTVRFAWVRRGIWQVYSSVGLGLGVERYEMSRNELGPIYRTYCYCAYDIKPIGLSVGCKWFGFIEVGSGSRGVVNVGFGCRINSKIK